MIPVRTGWVSSRKRESICSIAVFHGSHESFEESLEDIFSLLPRGNCLNKFVVVGDWNVDQLPTLAVDPFADSIGRSNHHFDRRQVLNAWLEAHKLDLTLPEVWFGVPQCFADEFCIRAPISRVPKFVQFSTLGHIPSLLDYGASSSNTVLSSSIEWENRISDHAW